MKKLSIKKVVLVLGVTALVAACTKEKKEPVVEVQLEMAQSRSFDYAEVGFGSMFLYGISEEGDTFKSNLQGRSQTTKHGKSLKDESRSFSILTQEHFEMNLVAVKPQLELYVHLGNSGLNQKVVNHINIDKVLLERPVVMRKNKTYTVKFDIDTDRAIGLSNGQLTLDWKYIKARVISR